MARRAKPSSGVIGLGTIGSRAVNNLRKAGYLVWVWNRTPKPEPNFLSSPLEVAESVKHIQIFVSDGAALLDVVRAMAPALTQEHVVINHSTVSPQETSQAEAIVRERQASFLDAPFTGGKDAAETGQLVFLIGGNTATLEKVRPLLEKNSKAIIPIGEVGQATAIKVATNIVAAAMAASFAESLSLLQKSGVPLHKMGEVLEHHAVRSPLADIKLPGMIKGDFDSRFSLNSMFRDVQIALSMAAEYGIELPSTAAFAGTAMSGINNGWGDSDYSVIARHYGYPNPENPLPGSLFASVAKDNDAEKETAEKKNSKPWTLFGGRK